jgi:hypothetical protein
MHDMLDWLPGDASPLYGHHRTWLRWQPGAQSDQGTGGGTTSDQLWGALAFGTAPTPTGRPLRRMDSDTTTDPGMCLIGLPILLCRRSSFIADAGNDARYLSAYLASSLRG